MREADNQRLLTLVLPHLQKQFGKPVDEAAQARLLAGMDGLKQRAKTMIELAESASFYVSRPSFPLSNGKAQRLLEGDGPAFLAATVPVLAVLEPWAHDALEAAMRRMAEPRSEGRRVGKEWFSTGKYRWTP